MAIVVFLRQVFWVHHTVGRCIHGLYVGVLRWIKLQPDYTPRPTDWNSVSTNIPLFKTSSTSSYQIILFVFGWLILSETTQINNEPNKDTRLKHACEPALWTVVLRCILLRKFCCWDSQILYILSCRIQKHTSLRWPATYQVNSIHWSQLLIMEEQIQIHMQCKKRRFRRVDAFSQQHMHPTTVVKRIPCFLPLHPNM